MALHDDGTMDVLVDGVTERRPYTVNFPGGGVLPRYDPEVRDGERLVRSIGCTTPVVIRDGGRAPGGPYTGSGDYLPVPSDWEGRR